MKVGEEGLHARPGRKRRKDNNRRSEKSRVSPGARDGSEGGFSSDDYDGGMMEDDYRMIIGEANPTGGEETTTNPPRKRARVEATKAEVESNPI